MKSKLENFDIFICDKCCEIVMIHDADTLNKANSHALDCICNKELVSQYKSELKACNSDIELKIVHKKYINLL